MLSPGFHIIICNVLQNYSFPRPEILESESIKKCYKHEQNYACISAGPIHYGVLGQVSSIYIL